MPGVGKKNFDEQKCSSLPFKDMVIKIKENPVFFEGKSGVFINKIKETKNKGDSGWGEIRDALNIELEGEARRKIDKYLNKVGMKYDDFIKDKIINKEVVASFNNEEFANQSKDVVAKERTAENNEVDRNSLCNRKEKFNVMKSIKYINDKVSFKKINKCDEVKGKIEKTGYDSFECLIKELEGGASLSDIGESYIKFLMSYIIKKEPCGSESNIRKELECVFLEIDKVLFYFEDKMKVLIIYQDARFSSLYNSSCRVATYAIESLLEKKGFQKEIITKIKKYLINYSNEYLVKLKLNEYKYNDYIKNIKKFSDFDIFKGVESIDKIIFLKGILSENKFTSEGRRFLTKLSDNLKDEKIIDFIKEKMNLDVEFLKSEYDSKCFEEKNKIIDAAIARIKSMLIIKSISKNIVDSVVEIINGKRINANIERFLSKIDLIVNILKYKRIKANKIASDIEHYLDISMDKLKLEVEIAKSKEISFKERMFSLFNNLNNRMLNFIYNVRHSFK